MNRISWSLIEEVNDEQRVFGYLWVIKQGLPSYEGSKVYARIFGFNGN